MAKNPTRTAAGSRKMAKTMREFSAGNLRSGGSGSKVTDPAQAKAIGLSQARRANRKK